MNNKGGVFEFVIIYLFIILVRFRLINVDMIFMLTIHKHDLWARIITPSYIIVYFGLNVF